MLLNRGGTLISKTNWHTYLDRADPRVIRTGAMKRVCVVGGGWAGLSACHRLLIAGQQLEVVLYEATDGVGGRSRTGLVSVIGQYGLRTCWLVLLQLGREGPWAV